MAVNTNAILFLTAASDVLASHINLHEIRSAGRDCSSQEGESSDPLMRSADSECSVAQSPGWRQDLMSILDGGPLEFGVP
jgi:hypothetical protein